jgi:methyltransferase family protein
VPLDYSTDLGRLDRLKNDLSLRVRRGTFELFMRECQPTPDARIADLGVSGHGDHPAHYFFELLYPYRDRLTAIGRAEEGAGWLPEAFPGLNFVEADLRSIPLPDNYFDAGICNAVLEHAGTYAEQRALVREVCRVCRVVLFTTPNKYFPLELHTFLPFVHWLPEPQFRAVLRRLGQTSFADIHNLNLLDRATFASLFPPERRNRVMGVGLPLLHSNLVCVSSLAHDGVAALSRS